MHGKKGWTATETRGNDDRLVERSFPFKLRWHAEILFFWFMHLKSNLKTIFLRYSERFIEWFQVISWGNIELCTVEICLTTVKRKIIISVSDWKCCYHVSPKSVYHQYLQIGLEQHQTSHNRNLLDHNYGRNNDKSLC